MEQNVDFITKQNAKELGSPANYREIVFTSTAFGGDTACIVGVAASHALCEVGECLGERCEPLPAPLTFPCACTCP